MSNYSPATDFSVKDSLPQGNAAKKVKGTELNTEFEAIETAIATKADLASPALTGTATTEGITVNGTFKLGDTSDDHTYTFAVNELTADRTVTWPLLTGNDTLVFEDHTATLTQKTIDLTDNTLQGTKAEFTAAVEDGTILFSGDDSSIDHDSLTNYVANEHIDWTSTSSNFSTSGTAATGTLTVTGNIVVSGNVDGIDISGIEAGADVTDETNVKAALDGATLTNVDPASDDEILIQDTSDSDNLKTITASDLIGLANANFDTITTAGAGTWTKPDNINFIYVELWGAGAGGGNRTDSGNENGGGGGAFVAKLFPASAFSGDQDYVVGEGGTGHANGSTGNGTDGGDTTFGDGVVIIALGGLATGAGAGGYVDIGANDWNVAGGGGNGAVGGSSAHGGAGGGGPTASVSLSGGSSTFGGAGGDGIHTAATPGEDGTAPGGGGGGSSNDGGGGDGADGKINIWSW